MAELPPGCKEYKLPAGSQVKIAGMPYELKESAVVIGAADPECLPCGNKTDQSATMGNPLQFIAGRGTRFEIDGPDVIIDRGGIPVSRVPFVDLIEFANNHPLKAKPDAPTELLP